MAGVAAAASALSAGRVELAATRVAAGVAERPSRRLVLSPDRSTGLMASVPLRRPPRSEPHDSSFQSFCDRSDPRTAADTSAYLDWYRALKLPSSIEPNNIRFCAKLTSHCGIF